MTSSEKANYLATAASQRIDQLGLSRREFVRRSGLSRQTLNRILMDGETNLRPGTFHVLDAHLMWIPGTALSLANGELTDAKGQDGLTLADRDLVLRYRIVQRVDKLTPDQVLRVSTFLEGI